MAPGPAAPDMLRDELDATRELLRGLGPAEWQRRAVPGQTVRELVLAAIFRYEEAAGNSRMPLARGLGAARRRRLDAARPGAPPAQLADELGYWGNRAAARHRGHPSAGALLREAWLDRIAIAEAVGRHVDPGPHGREIVRQAVLDAVDAWAGGRAVVVEITGPAGGRWVAGDGRPAATVRAGPAGFLRLVTDRPNGHAEATGDAGTAAAFLTTRI